MNFPFMTSENSQKNKYFSGENQKLTKLVENNTKENQFSPRKQEKGIETNSKDKDSILNIRFNNKRNSKISLDKHKSQEKTDFILLNKDKFKSNIFASKKFFVNEKEQRSQSTDPVASHLQVP